MNKIKVSFHLLSRSEIRVMDIVTLERNFHDKLVFGSFVLLFKSNSSNNIFWSLHAFLNVFKIN